MAPASTVFIEFVATSCAALFIIHALKWYNMRKIMPPGPLGNPLTGNTSQMPAVKPWRRFKEWNEIYGPVVSIFLGSTPVIVLGSAQAAWDLLEKRSEIYSSRPRFIVAGEILSDNKRGLMLPNNENWRKWRRILHNGFHVRRVDSYKDIQSLESKAMLYDLLVDPKAYEKHIQRYAASVVTSVTYGRRVETVDEWVVRENMEAMDYLTRMQAATIPDCLTVQCLNDFAKIGMTDLELAYALSTPFGAGIETTAVTLTVLILAMLHFPDVMTKAQQELDRVVGQQRMPEYSDEPHLPYIRAIVNETLRWRPVAVLGGTPHAVIADDSYRGWSIPKGSTIFANLYGILKDPEMFPEPETFRPERFMETEDPRLRNFDLPFGFGRRQCPGIHLARNSLFANTARILWAFNITPVKDDNLNDILPDTFNFTNGFNSKPVSFECNITPRNDNIAQLIEREWDDAKAILNNWV
ncbi:hypothetical protein AAF712_005428 [Marasmius tenuissimus]|uniref:Cytochrome P450 n=1 Tax=Marasmius tenuissimus TaxID=585030 RepID=A0ABR3A265_9AGAR